jgi:phosphonate metabolism protein (transferase hexapeptide repeat family)
MLSINPFVEENVSLTNVTLGAYTEIQEHCVLNDVIIGDYTYCAGYNQIDYAVIGKFCSIATFARINPGNHPTYTRAAQHHFTYRSALFGFGEDDEEFFAWRKAHSVIIGHDVWIGHNAVVMPGITIGNGAVIGSSAVVTKDVEPYSIVVGVPAQKIKKRFPDAMIEKLEQIKWWDWDYETLKSRLSDFRDMNAFAGKYCR